MRKTELRRRWTGDSLALAVRSAAPQMVSPHVAYALLVQMTYHKPRERSLIRFAEKVLALLDQGSFTATHKYAVLLGLLDL